MKTVLGFAGSCLVASVLLACGATAQDDEALMRGLKRCATIENPQARLVCYDALAEVVAPENKPATAGAAPVAPPAVNAAPRQPAPAAAPKSVETPSRKDSFGAERLKREQERKTRTTEEKKKKTDNRISYNVASVRKDGTGRYLFTMQNGQVWRQLEPGYVPVPRSTPFSVTISEGRLGDYKLRIGGKSRLTRVRRVK